MERSQVISRSSTGYFLEPTKHRSPHALCGPKHIDGAVSPNSGLPLLLVASLDPADTRLGISRSKTDTIALLYSWTCGISDGDFTYRQSAQGVEILAYNKGPAHGDFPYSNYPVFFPRVAVELQALTSEEQTAIRQINRREVGSVSIARRFPRLAVPRAQVGGEPRLMQWPVSTCVCPVCGGSMPLLASIGNGTGSALGFTDNDFVQMVFFLCDTCTVVTACNMCD
jgi:hypothetical protein